jgi:hypothetical protein
MTAALLIAAAILTLAGVACVWAWLICLGRGLERVAARPAAIFAVVLFVLAFAAVGTALAHGDASWIMANPRYVDRDGVHCCGPADCRREHAAKFRETPAGIEIVTRAGDVVLMPRALVGLGLYPSIDDDWWVCIRGGVVRCIFKPSTAG